MFAKIKHGEWEFDAEDFKHVSDEAKDLIRSLLEPNPDLRMTAARALRSKWINEDAKMLSSRDLSQGVMNLKERRPRLLDVARAFMGIGGGIGGVTKNMLGNLKTIQSGGDSSHELL